jgi:hypothetical protein
MNDAFYDTCKPQLKSDGGFISSKQKGKCHHIKISILILIIAGRKFGIDEMKVQRWSEKVGGISKKKFALRDKRANQYNKSGSVSRNIP